MSDKCVVCERPKPFPLSYGGPDICSECDCGPPTPKQARLLREALREATEHSLQAIAELSALRECVQAADGLGDSVQHFDGGDSKGYWYCQECEAEVRDPEYWISDKPDPFPHTTLCPRRIYDAARAKVKP